MNLNDRVWVRTAHVPTLHPADAVVLEAEAIVAAAIGWEVLGDE